jgi:Relaxase/Mobilisation nuclease domain
MILKASQRAGGRQLAAHLLRTDDNEHVELHELRGFVADDLDGAFAEAYASSKGTRAKQFLFSLSLNPPPKERVSTETFEAAINQVEQRLGLSGQPRAVVFHEKDGRRHAHAVWSRIDTEAMKAVNLPHYKLKLRDIARELYLEHGWQMPRGFVTSEERDPFNCSLKEWQQMQRTGHDRKAIQQMFRECWAISDSGKAFAQALKARGYTARSTPSQSTPASRPNRSANGSAIPRTSHPLKTQSAKTPRGCLRCSRPILNVPKKPTSNARRHFGFSTRKPSSASAMSAKS